MVRRGRGRGHVPGCFAVYDGAPNGLAVIHHSNVTDLGNRQTDYSTTQLDPSLLPPPSHTGGVSCRRSCAVWPPHSHPRN